MRPRCDWRRMVVVAMTGADQLDWRIHSDEDVRDLLAALATAEAERDEARENERLFRKDCDTLLTEYRSWLAAERALADRLAEALRDWKAGVCQVVVDEAIAALAEYDDVRKEKG